MEPGSAKRCGVRVCCSEDGREQTTLLYDARAGELQCDTTRSSLGFGRKVVEGRSLELPPGEPLRLRVFVDRSIVEVYANERQGPGNSRVPHPRGAWRAGVRRGRRGPRGQRSRLGADALQAPIRN